MGLVVLGLVVVGAVGAGLARARRPLPQPIAFNHQLHVEEMGAECSDCHQHVLTGVRATIPNIGVCSDCHEEAQTESLEELPRISVEDRQRVQFQRPIFQLQVSNGHRSLVKTGHVVFTFIQDFPERGNAPFIEVC